MNRKKDRWQRCYWQEWAAIKKRWDEVHTAWHELAEDSARQNEVRISMDHPKGDARSLPQAP